MFSILGAVQSIPYVATGACLFLLWNILVENPSVRHEARQGYVMAVELETAKATLAEKERQAEAAIAAGNNLAAVLKESAAALAEKDKVRQLELDKYAETIKREKRSCPLTADDIRRLQ